MISLLVVADHVSMSINWKMKSSMVPEGVIFLVIELDFIIPLIEIALVRVELPPRYYLQVVHVLRFLCVPGWGLCLVLYKVLHTRPLLGDCFFTAIPFPLPYLLTRNLKLFGLENVF